MPVFAQITLAPPSGCTLTQPANYTCESEQRINTQIPLGQFSSCTTARITSRMSGSAGGASYIFRNSSAANTWAESVQIVNRPAVEGTYISGCSTASTCDMLFSPSEIGSGANLLYLVASRSFRGPIIVSAGMHDVNEWIPKSTAQD